jgi:hypothetical protein
MPEAACCATHQLMAMNLNWQFGNTSNKTGPQPLWRANNFNERKAL